MTQTSIQLTLPKAAGEYGLSAIVPILNKVGDHAEIVLDFKDVSFYSPAPIVTLLARIRYWRNNGKKVIVINHRTCPATKYLQRIDFFDQLGLQFEEVFIRKPSLTRFVSIKRVTQGSEVDFISKEVAECMCNNLDNPSDLKESLRYSIGEILTNVVQHSHGEGFICAQRYPRSNMIHVAISDNGIGLQQSFEGTELEQELTTPIKALQKALEPEVSAALLKPPTNPYHTYVNRGIGLSMVDELIRQTFGCMRVITENALYKRVGDTSVRFQEKDDLRCPGVTVELEMNVDEIGNFGELIANVRSQVTPTELDNWDEMFD